MTDLTLPPQPPKPEMSDEEKLKQIEAAKQYDFTHKVRGTHYFVVGATRNESDWKIHVSYREYGKPETDIPINRDFDLFFDGRFDYQLR